MGQIRVSGLGKAYKQYPNRWSRLFEWLVPFSPPRHHLHWILREVEFTIEPGEAVGIVGVNGAGKSTLLKMIAGTTQPTCGEIRVAGRVAALLELGMGFHPDFTGRQNVFMAGQLLGMQVEEIQALMPDIEAFAEIGEAIEQPVRTYSSGMQMRLAFSVATARRPDILIVDEALSVGDAYFQHKSFERIRSFRKAGTTLLIVSHDRSAIQSICDSAILLEQGRMAMRGRPEEVMDYYNALLAEREGQTVRQEMLADGQVRTISGTGEAAILDVRMVDQRQRALEVVEVGQAVTLEVEVEVRQDIERLLHDQGPPRPADVRDQYPPPGQGPHRPEGRRAHHLPLRLRHAPGQGALLGGAEPVAAGLAPGPQLRMARLRPGLPCHQQPPGRLRRLLLAGRRNPYQPLRRGGSGPHFRGEHSMTRLLVECTYVFEHPKVNSGIQRVVRNVIRELPEADETVECIPVAMLDGTLYQVHSLAPLDPRPHSPLVRLRILVERAANYFWLGQRTLEKRRPFRSSPWARRLLYVACRLFAFAFLSIPLRLLDRILGKQQPAPVRATPLEHRAGDQLVLLDSSWHADFFPLAERLKSEGVGIVSVIYDLIPLTHPQFCDAGLVKVFNHWFDWIAATADGYVAISETIRDEVRAEMLRRIGPEKVAQRWFDYFHLGSELDLVEDGASVEPDLLRMFKAKAPVFLMVSTIEPRKNHGYLLDAFERAWAQGSQARLCIAGRIGWKCEALVERVRQHPELNKRLFMFNDLSDKSLEYAYSHAASLVFPSYVEGFGLPLVEAMQRGLPAMGSDIPVFREIGGEFMAYFDLADPQTLANLVTRFEATGEFPAERPVGEWRWIGWHEASRQLIARILLALGKAPAHGEAVHADCG